MYKLTISTGRMSGAGTDANVFIKLYGDRGTSKEKRLNGLISGDAFESGDREVVRLALPSVGKIRKVRIRHDDRWWGAGWFLNYLTLREPATGTVAHLPCYRWLDSSLGDGEISRVLRPVTRARRPVHVIAHMCNTPRDVDEALARGANAIECDIQVVRTAGGKLGFTVHHGYRPFLREKSRARTALVPYLRHLAAKTKPPVMIFDCKEPPASVDVRAYGAALCRIVGAHLRPDRCVMSVPTEKMARFFDGARSAGFDDAGFDISMFDTSPAGEDPNSWANAAERNGASWLGVGIDSFAPFSPVRNWIEPLIASAKARDTRGVIRKVYYWTLDSADSMRGVLSTDVDGILVNDPKTLCNVLREEEFRFLFRKAKPSDPIL